MNPGTVFPQKGLAEFLGRNAGKDIQGHLGTDSGNPEEKQENFFFLRSEKTEKLNGILADMGIDMKSYPLLNSRQVIKRRKGNSLTLLVN